MRLKSLELIGFKSFVDRTVVNFDSGITAVVGPNGSGKSNVVDAIRWVMGEQSAKHLRGSEMSDVIFNGSETRPATGMSSVFLTFDNSDGRAPAEYASYSEITIGRRLYRSGESEYYINKVPCRLKDVVDFFLGTGVGTKAYSIVEQGQVERIVSARPEERRQLLEEAAGISKFKMHRDSALRKIEATKQNLARLTDIIAELEHQKNSLSRQAKKAERYKILADELRDLELSMAAHSYRDWTGALDSLHTQINTLSEEEASKGAELSNIETTIDSLRLEMTDTEHKLNALQEKIYEFQNKLRLNETEVKFKSDHLEERRKRNEEDIAEINTLKQKKQEQEEEIERVNSSKVNADVELASFEETVSEISLKAAEVQENLGRVDKRIEELRLETVECVRSISELKTRVEGIEQNETDITSKIARNQTEIDSIDQKIAEINHNISGASGQLSDMKTAKEATYEELERLLTDSEKNRTDLIHGEAEYNELNSNLSVKKSRLISLEELSANFEGYNDGVKAILKKKAAEEAMSGICGTISEMIETEPQYETAVGAVLGEKLQYVVVKSHQEGVEAIDYLKTQSAGRSTFVPLELREFSEETRGVEGEGVIGRLLDHVRFADEYKKVGNYLFKDVILVEDMRRALDSWGANGGKKTFVTLDGEVVDRYGVVTGGSSGDVSGRFLAQKREISDLRIEVSRLSSEVKEKGEQVNTLKNRLQVDGARITQLKNDMHTKDVEFVHKERDVQGLAQQSDNLKNTRDRLTLETAELAGKRDVGIKEKGILVQKISRTEENKRVVEEQISGLVVESDRLKEEITSINEELTSKKVQLASLQEQSASLDREINTLSALVSEEITNIEALGQDMEEGQKDTLSTERDIVRIKEEMGVLVAEIERATNEQSELKAQYDKITEELRSREISLREVRKNHEEIKGKVYELKMDETKIQEKVFYLEREMQEKYHIDLGSKNQEFELKLEKNEEISQALERFSARLSELKERIEKMGSVNSDAISEYDSVFKRYEFLTKQSEDLKISIETLQKAILRINRTSKERFVETFDAVNERFKALFPRLFKGGGKAELILLDQENVLESGIEITAQPPGKKLQSVGLLSGGEKALVATTFIFSIFLIKPSPFCLLDEVDAPLDDANIDRFNQLVREMSGLSQFIMITHNRRTMELADTLYGVTMEEPGVSKILSVRLENAKDHAATE